MFKSILLSWSIPCLCGIFIFSSPEKFNIQMNYFLICIFAMMIVRDIIFCILGRRREKSLSAKESACTKKEHDLQEKVLFLEDKERSIDRMIEEKASSRFRSAFRHLTSTSLFSKADFEVFIESFKDALPGTRGYKALTEDFSISEISCTAKIKSKDNDYTTTLTGCSCTDFKLRKKPCKHMSFLALHLGALSTENVEDVRIRLSSLQRQIDSRMNEIKQYTLFAKFFKELNSHNGYSAVASLFGELEKYRGNAYCKVMKTKKNPAIKSAEIVSELSKEKTELITQVKEYKFKLDTILTVLPETQVLFTKSPKKLLDANAKSDLLKRLDLLIHDIEKSKAV